MHSLRASGEARNVPVGDNFGAHLACDGQGSLCESLHLKHRRRAPPIQVLLVIEAILIGNLGVYDVPVLRLFCLSQSSNLGRIKIPPNSRGRSVLLKVSVEAAPFALESMAQ